jgi:hypothetical protein
MSSSSVYVHFEGDSTWTKKISLSSGIVTVEDLVQAFSVMYEEKYGKKLQSDQLQVFLERNQDPLTRRSVKKSKSIRKALQLEDEEEKGVVEIVIVHSKKENFQVESRPSTATIDSKSGMIVNQTQDQEILKGLLQIATEHLSKKNFRSAREGK